LQNEQRRGSNMSDKQFSDISASKERQASILKKLGVYDDIQNENHGQSIPEGL